MARWRNVLSIFLALCGQASAQTVTGHDDEPVPVTFKIAAVPNRASASPDSRSFIATYGSGGDQAKFLIELDGKRVKGVSENGTDPGVDITFSTGSFRHLPGSMPAVFLRKLAAALEAKAPKLSLAKAEGLPFEIAILGDHVGRGPNGGFDGKPGNWVTAKLFLADGNAEVYFNFDPISGDAEFSLKDKDYGNTVVGELSKVLW